MLAHTSFQHCRLLLCIPTTKSCVVSVVSVCLKAPMNSACFLINTGRSLLLQAVQRQTFGLPSMTPGQKIGHHTHYSSDHNGDIITLAMCTLLRAPLNKEKSSRDMTGGGRCHHVSEGNKRHKKGSNHCSGP